MPWFQVDDQLSLHRKVSAAGNAAMGLWVRAGSWSMQNLTDGFIPSHIARVLGTQSQIKKLVEVRLWHEVPGGYQFHEWDTRQMSAAEITERRRKRALAGAKGGKAGNSTQASASASALADAQALVAADAQANSKQNATPGPGPVPLVVTKEGGVTSVGDCDDPEPPRYCDAHPNDTPHACPACIPRRTAHDAWKKRQKQREEDQLAQQRAKKMLAAQRLKDCPECDEEGWRKDDYSVRCRAHLEVS